MKNRLFRDEQHKVIGGVCAGLAEYFEVDISIVRLLFVLGLIIGGSTFLCYIVLWIVVPRRPFDAPVVDYNTPDYAVPLQPSPYAPLKRRVSGGRLIIGLVLVMLGGYLLLDEFNLIPDVDFDKIWPVILIVMGLVLMFGFWRRHPVQQPADTSWNANQASSTDQSSTL